MRVLILSCNTGAGHNSCAKAIKEVYDAKGDDCDITDALKFISKNFSRFIAWGHIFMYRNIPWFFNWGYRFAEKHTGAFKEKSILYNIFGRGAEGLYELITSKKYDAVICTHPFASLMLTETQRRFRLPVKTAFVATDYTCSPSVKDSSLNYYFIPDEILTDDFLCPNIPKEKMVASGIPIRQMFYKRMKKDVAKKMFELPEEHKHIVIACGSMGCGPLKKLVGMMSEQLRNGIDITVICGTNEKLKNQLEDRYGNRSNLHIRGYVKDMSTMLDSADLYLTKPGGISVTEAATKNLPMVYIKAVAGCEDYNGRFYCEIGGAKYGADIEELTQICQVLLETTEYNKMENALSRHIMCNAAECIYETLNAH